MPRLPDIKLPDIKFPKWDQIPEPIIYAPELEYPVLNWPSVAPRAAGRPPADKPRQAKQKPVPRRKGNDNTEPGSGAEVETAKEKECTNLRANVIRHNIPLIPAVKQNKQPKR